MKKVAHDHKLGAYGATSSKKLRFEFVNCGICVRELSVVGKHLIITLEIYVFNEKEKLGNPLSLTSAEFFFYHAKTHFFIRSAKTISTTKWSIVKLRNPFSPGRGEAFGLV